MNLIKRGFDADGNELKSSEKFACLQHLFIFFAICFMVIIYAMMLIFIIVFFIINFRLNFSLIFLMFCLVLLNFLSKNIKKV